MTSRLSEGKKRYSLSLTQATMESLQEQLSKVGVKSPRQAAGLITLMVDDFLGQMDKHIMPVVVQSIKDDKKEMSPLAFMKAVFDAMDEISR